MTNPSIEIKPDHKQKLINKLCSKPGLRGRLDAKCIECIYDPIANGTWRLQVKECTSWSCPLFPARPISETKKQ